MRTIRLTLLALLVATTATPARAGTTPTCNEFMPFKAIAECLAAKVLRNGQTGQCCHEQGWWEDYDSGCKCVQKPTGPTTTTSSTIATPCIHYPGLCGEKDGTDGGKGQCCEGENLECGQTNDGDGHRACQSTVPVSRLRNENEACHFITRADGFIQLVDPFCDTAQGLVASRVGNNCVCKKAAVPTTTTSNTSTTRPRPTTTSTSSTTSTTIATTRARFATGAEFHADIPVEFQCRFRDGRTADQSERVLIYLQGQTEMVNGLVLMKYLPGLQRFAYTSTNASDLESEDKRLRCYYASEMRNGIWRLLNGCNDYGHISKGAERIRTAILSNPSARQACATSPYRSKEFLAWTRMVILNGECVADRVKYIPPAIEEDRDDRLAGTLNYNLPLQPISPAFRQAIHDWVMLHHATDDAFCNGTPPPAASVPAGMLKLIEMAPTPEWKHAITVVFPTVRDEGDPLTHVGGWERKQHCVYKRLQGLSLTLWDACVDLPGIDIWMCLYPTRETHFAWHRCAALRNDKLVAVNDHVTELKKMGRLPKSAKETQLTSQTARTCEEWLKCETGEVPGCRSPWVPVGLNGEPEVSVHAGDAGLGVLEGGR
jgi:hypothetical protein